MHSLSEALKRACVAAGLGLIACAVVACTSDASGDGGTTAGAAAGSDAPVKCPADTPVFSATPTGGLTVASGSKALSARVILAKPTEPTRYRNDWTVQFLDAAGAPVNDVVLSDACAWMYVHNHGGPAMTVTQLADKSTYQLTELNLFMPGPWSIELAVTSPSHPAAADGKTKCDDMGKRLGTDKISIPVCVKDE